jgi:metal transporter CNNM
MYAMYPIAYPTAKLLDAVLGKEVGMTYKKAGLKTLVSLHRTFGTERLNDDEVTIITAVLDLKEKPIGDIMTPMKDVYVMSAEQTMDVNTMNEILSKGYSRIPIHSPGKKEDFIGMLLVKTLITYDPEEELSVSSFTLATLPETKPSTSALDILNYFQEYFCPFRR